MLARSAIRKFFIADKSTVRRFGPTKAPRPLLPNVPAGCKTNAVGSNHASGRPTIALSYVLPAAILARSFPMPGPSDGAHCDRDRLDRTNTVKGFPLRIAAMP